MNKLVKMIVALIPIGFVIAVSSLIGYALSLINERLFYIGWVLGGTIMISPALVFITLFTIIHIKGWEK